MFPIPCGVSVVSGSTLPLGDDCSWYGRGRALTLPRSAPQTYGSVETQRLAGSADELAGLINAVSYCLLSIALPAL